ncbi:hypothetical protein EIP91_007573 [Steccherinum ochraceum]|uniref:Uncharacterized protein n=1 Tax=Steccherinum ochraceum TaxID=92696 RepID=A0A4V2MXA8_9APHY|nr:hypothetical protein EIP91_007573 [Steccherinum ochraceum]
MAARDSDGTQGGLTVPATRTRKRGLTVSAPHPDDLKKAKVEPPPLPLLGKPVSLATTSQPVDAVPPESTPQTALKTKPVVAVAEPASEAQEEESSAPLTTKEELEAERTYWAEARKERIFRLPGDGPHTFFVFCEAINGIFHGVEDDVQYFVQKSTMMDVMAKTEEMDEDEEEEARELTSEIMDQGGFWEPVINEDDAKTEEAKALQKVLSDVKSTGYADWYEVTVQKAKPAKGVPALEIKKWRMRLNWYKVAEDQQCSWWITGVALPDEESSEAALIISENVPPYYA